MQYPASLKTCIYSFSYSPTATPFDGLYKFPNKALIPLPLSFPQNNNSLSSLSLSLSLSDKRKLQIHSKSEGLSMEIWVQFHRHLLVIFLLTWAASVPTTANMEGKHGFFIWVFFKLIVISSLHLFDFIFSVG